LQKKKLLLHSTKNGGEQQLEELHWFAKDSQVANTTMLGMN